MSPLGGTSELVSVVVSLIVILACLSAAACLARRWRIGGGIRRPRGGAGIRVLAAQPIGWQSSLQIVEAEGQRFLIAAGRSGVTAIGRLNAPASGFADLLDGPAGPDMPSEPSS